MGIETYLGNPPQHIVDWIKSHSKPTTREKTLITFTDGTTEEYDLSGEMTQETMIDAGLGYIDDESGYTWVKSILTIEIGTKVTSISDGMFSNCLDLTIVTIPDSVTNIGFFAFNGCSKITSITIGSGITSIQFMAFSGCNGLTNVVFKGQTLAQVQAMENYPWGISDTNIITVA